MTLADQLAVIQRFNDHRDAYQNQFPDPHMYWVPVIGDWQNIAPEHINDPGSLPSSVVGTDFLSITRQWASIVANHNRAVWSPRTGKWVLTDGQPGAGATLPFIEQMNRELDSVKELHLTPALADEAREEIIKRYFGAGHA